ncbi:MAG: hypothetical protein ACMV1B_05970 [Prevotella sp.]
MENVSTNGVILSSIFFISIKTINDLRGYKRKKDADADLPRIVSDINGGVFTEERKITFIEYADKWLNYV